MKIFVYYNASFDLTEKMDISIGEYEKIAEVNYLPNYGDLIFLANTNHIAGGVVLKKDSQNFYVHLVEISSDLEEDCNDSFLGIVFNNEISGVKPIVDMEFFSEIRNKFKTDFFYHLFRGLENISKGRKSNSEFEESIYRFIYKIILANGGPDDEKSNLITEKLKRDIRIYNMQIDYLLKEKEMILSRYLPSCMENIDILRLSEIPESAEKEMSMNERHILQSNIDELNAEIYICNKKINSKNEIIEKLTNNKRLMVALKGREY